MLTKFNFITEKGETAMAGTGMYEEARRFLREPQEAVRELAIRMEQLRRWRELSDRVTSVLKTVFYSAAAFCTPPRFFAQV